MFMLNVFDRRSGVKPAERCDAIREIKSLFYLQSRQGREVSMRRYISRTKTNNVQKRHCPLLAVGIQGIYQRAEWGLAVLRQEDGRYQSQAIA